MIKQLEWLFEHVLNLRVPIFIVVIGITAFFGYHASKLTIDPSLESWIVKDDPALVYYREFKKIFGSDEILVVSYSVDNLFTIQEIQFLKDLTQQMERIKDVEEVISLTNALKVRGENNAINISPLIEKIPETQEEMDKLKDEIINDELYVGNLISSKADTVAIVLRLADRDDNLMRQRIMDTIRKMFKEHGGKREFHIAGIPSMKVHITESAFRDLKIFLPLTMLVTIIVLYYIFGTLRSIFIPMTAGILAMIWVFGILKLFGRNINIVTPIIIPMSFIYGTSISIHIFSTLVETGNREDWHRTLIKSLSKVAIPCFMTSFTTVIGFASNGVSKVLPIREAGLLTALAITLTYIFSFTIIPILLSTRLGIHGGGAAQEGEGYSIIDRILPWIGRTTLRYKKSIIVIFTIISITAIYGITQIVVETDMLRFFKKSNPLRQAYEFVESRIGGYNPLEVVIEGEPDALKKPEVLKKIDNFVNEALKIPKVEKAIAITEYIKAENQAFNNGNKAHFSIPDSSGLVSEYLFLLEGQEEITALITPDYSKARISLRLHSMSSTELKETVERVKEVLSRNLPAGCNGTVTGSAILYANMVNDIVLAQVESLLIAFFCIFIMMTINLKSIKVGALSMIPNIFPILVNLGIMGFFGITLNISTAMVSAIAIGIAVDDTIHFIYRIWVELDKDGDYNKSAYRAITTVGRPMVFTSAVITAGYIIICLSSFMPNVYAGMLTAITMIVALLADLFLTPVIFELFKPWGEVKLKDSVDIRRTHSTQ
jgi:predicted RND superfamily exporter protein